MASMFINGSGLNEQSLQKTFHRWFLPSFSSVGKAVSEQIIIFKSTNQKQKMPMTAMFVNESNRNEQSLQRTFHICFLLSFGTFDQAIAEKQIFQESTIQKIEWHVATMFADGSSRNKYPLQKTFHRCFVPCFSSLDYADSEDNIFFRNLPIRKMNCL